VDVDPNRRVELRRRKSHQRWPRRRRSSRPLRRAGSRRRVLLTYPPDGSAAYWAFRAYRDTTAQARTSKNWSLPATAPSGLSTFASISEDGKKIVAVVLNLDPQHAIKTDFTLDGCSDAKLAQRFTYSSGQIQLERATTDTLEPFSINVFESDADYFAFTAIFCGFASGP